MSKRIHVIINPAAGKPDAILNKLNAVFREAGVRWDVSITHKSGDATRFTQQALADGVDVVAAYGGDGSVMEVARGVKGGDVPMAILPGGTANLMSVELGIPKDLSSAAQIACSPDSVVRNVDMGQVGERYFMLRVGMGFAGDKVKLADRELKDRYGIMAYTIAGLKALKISQKAHYQINIDGQQIETEALSCLIDNAGNIGIAGLAPSKKISVSDGLLDVILVSDVGFSSFVAAAASVTDRTPDQSLFQYWQGREINIITEPTLDIQGDGEMWGKTPVFAKVIPGILPVLTPKT